MSLEKEERQETREVDRRLERQKTETEMYRKVRCVETEERARGKKKQKRKAKVTGKRKEGKGKKTGRRKKKKK